MSPTIVIATRRPESTGRAAGYHDERAHTSLLDYLRPIQGPDIRYAAFLSKQQRALLGFSCALPVRVVDSGREDGVRVLVQGGSQGAGGLGSWPRPAKFKGLNSGLGNIAEVSSVREGKAAGHFAEFSPRQAGAHARYFELIWEATRYLLIWH